MNQCQWTQAWVGQCRRFTPDNFCEEHIKACASCGDLATHDCAETMGLVCGAPLCNDCEHTLRENGCSSGAPLPEGLREHCKKSEQVYEPWYRTELKKMKGEFNQPWLM